MFIDKNVMNFENINIITFKNIIIFNFCQNMKMFVDIKFYDI